MRKIKVLLSVILLILVGCSKTSDETKTKEFSTEKPAYFIHQYSGGVKGATNEFVFIDAEGSITNLIELETSSDLCYASYNFDSNSNFYYMYGSGLFKIDLANQSVECLSEEYVSLLTFDELDNIYYYENNSIDDEKYKSKVCTKDEKCIQYTDFITTLGYDEGLLYVSLFKQNEEVNVIDIYNKEIKVNSIAQNETCSMFDKIKEDFNCYDNTSLFRMQDSGKVPLPFVDEFNNPISLKANLPYITEIDDELILIDTSSKFIYNMKIEEDKTILKVVKDVGHGYNVYPSFEENFVVLGNPNFGLKKLNLITLEVEDIQFNYTLDDPNMKIRTVIPIK